MLGEMTRSLVGSSLLFMVWPIADCELRAAPCACATEDTPRIPAGRRGPVCCSPLPLTCSLAPCRQADDGSYELEGELEGLALPTSLSASIRLRLATVQESDQVLYRLLQLASVPRRC